MKVKFKVDKTLAMTPTGRDVRRFKKDETTDAINPQLAQKLIEAKVVVEVKASGAGGSAGGGGGTSGGTGGTTSSHQNTSNKDLIAQLKDLGVEIPQNANHDVLVAMMDKADEEEEDIDFTKYTVPELQEFLKDNQVEYTKDYKKDDLIALAVKAYNEAE